MSAFAARPATPPRHRLPRWQRVALDLSGVLLLATGVAWLGLHYATGAAAGGLPHPLEAWSLKLHGLAAFAALFVGGALAAAHVPQGWRYARVHRRMAQRASGVALCVAATALAMTGYALYYFAPDDLRPTLGGVHAGIGLAMGIVLALHRCGI